MQRNRFITRCPQWLKIDVVLGHTWKGPTAHPSFSFKLVAQPHGVGGFSHNAREARWHWNQAKCGAGILLKTALHDIACMCYHFLLPELHPGMLVNTLTYPHFLYPYSSFFHILQAPSAGKWFSRSWPWPSYSCQPCVFADMSGWLTGLGPKVPYAYNSVTSHLQNWR